MADDLAATDVGFNAEGIPYRDKADLQRRLGGVNVEFDSEKVLLAGTREPIGRTTAASGEGVKHFMAEGPRGKEIVGSLGKEAWF